jgi:hypothetical protein
LFFGFRLAVEEIEGDAESDGEAAESADVRLAVAAFDAAEPGLLDASAGSELRLGKVQGQTPGFDAVASAIFRTHGGSLMDITRRTIKMLQCVFGAGNVRAEMTWHEKIVQLSIYGEAATARDTERLASELMECRNMLCKLLDVVDQARKKKIEEVLKERTV